MAMKAEKIQKTEFMAFRGYDPKDKNFILATWLRGLYLENSFFRKIEKKTYFKNYELILEKILSDPDTFCHIACHSEDASVIFGYAVMKNTETLHWTFVKLPFRRVGIMTDLLKPFKLKAVTHLTDLGYKLKPKSVVFDPFLI